MAETPTKLHAVNCGLDTDHEGPCRATIISKSLEPEPNFLGEITGSAVHHPDHYNAHPSGVECIDIVEHFNFNIGNAVKYLWRQGLKDGTPSIEDLKKAAWYLQREIERVQPMKSISGT